LTLPRRERVGFVCNGRRVAPTVFGATGTPPVLATTVGATVTGVAFLVLGPVAVGYAVRGLGAPPARLRGAPGRWPRQAVARSQADGGHRDRPDDQVAVVTLFTVFGASLKAPLDLAVSRSLRAMWRSAHRHWARAAAD
jgi:putative ABC transport system permease protein